MLVWRFIRIEYFASFEKALKICISCLQNHVIEYPDIKKAIENESSSFCSRKSDIEKESSTGSNFIASGILTLSFVVVAVLVVVVVGVVLYFKFFH